MITRANRPYVPANPAPTEPSRVAPHAALIPGWSEMAVWQPDAPGTRIAGRDGGTRGFMQILSKLLVR